MERKEIIARALCKATGYPWTEFKDFPSLVDCKTEEDHRKRDKFAAAYEARLTSQDLSNPVLRMIASLQADGVSEEIIDRALDVMELGKNR